MLARTLARRYATAVYDLAAQSNAVDRIDGDLERILAEIERNEDASRFFLAPIVDRYEKERVLTKVFEGRVDDLALHALLLLVRKHREALLRPMLEEYRELERSARGVEPLVVMSARPVGDEALASIAQRVERIYGRRFDVRLRVVPGLIGGLRIIMGDRRVDGTVAGRLEDLARTLTAPI
jgi:F-type H+-transporting ATPase subunit delta